MTTQYVILGTGQLGLAIMDELTAVGKPVRMVNRSGRVKETLPDGVSVLAADLYDPAAVQEACGGADVVFLCAQPAYTKWPEEFPPLVDSIIAGLTGLDVKLIFGDNLYMYGPTGGAPIHEGLPYAATGRKGKTRALLAERLMDAHRQGDIRVAIGRASDFYGPRVTESALGEMVFRAALEDKTANLMGDLDAPHTYTYIRDFARALVTLSREEEALGQVWHVPSAPTLTTRQILELLEREVGHPVKVRTAGKMLITLLGIFNPTLREMREMYYEFDEPFVVDDSKFRAAFDADVTPHEEAIAETLEWYRTHGEAG